jgi:hypothetical protein
MADTNPADWTDEYMARWMADRDGWRVVQDGKRWLVYEPNSHDWKLLTTDENEVNEWLLAGLFTCYPESIDAAVGWLGRMGLRWVRYVAADCVGVSNGTEWFTCAESPTCPTSRALCNAGAAAWLAREVRHA